MRHGKSLPDVGAEIRLVATVAEKVSALLKVRRNSGGGQRSGLKEGILQIHPIRRNLIRRQYVARHHLHDTVRLRV